MSPRILLAEDDPGIRTLIEELLTLDGYEVSAVVDGAEALTLLRSAPTDLVILDVMMPEVDGVSVLREIRGIAGMGQVPVILLTARADDESIWEGWRAGCNLYMTKPFEPDELISTIERLLKDNV